MCDDYAKICENCELISDYEHENACLKGYVEDMKGLLLRADKLLNCGPLFVHYTQRIEAENIREKISELIGGSNHENQIETIKSENERLTLANEKQNEVIRRQQEQIRAMQILLREIFNHLGKSNDIRERINDLM